MRPVLKDRGKLMRKFLIRSLTLLFAIVLFLIGAITIEFTFRRGRTPQIANAPTSVASLERIMLGAVEQWILIRGWNASNPVLLFLHGGPGMPAMYLAHDFQRELEKDFVIVHWDRRGAGKSYAAGVEGELTVRQTLDDTYELTRLLQKRFGQRRIYLVGHSAGTYLGMLAVWEHPEYYAAYIGIGQISMSPRRVLEVQKEFLLQKARESGDSVLVMNLQSESVKIREDELFRYGAELYKSTSFWPLLLTGLRAPEYTFTDAINVKKGADLVNRKMVYDVISGPLAEHVQHVDIPIFFFLGRHDYTTPSTLAAEYLDSLKCPCKRLVWFENSAHFPFYEEPEKFRLEMIKVDAETRLFWAKSNVCYEATCKRSSGDRTAANTPLVS
jgi:pimeloyl-ACP methyl ester carboxylesterase